MPNTIVEFTNEKWILLFPLVLIAFDVITGFIKGFANKEVSSTVMRKGLAKKLCEVLLIVVSIVACIALSIPSVFTTVVSSYICVMEAVSIIENLDSLGVPIPKILREAISKAKERGE